MTEEEAKSKWCPMVRVSIGEGMIVVNGPHKIIKDDMGIARKVNTECLGSACMMFRWDVTPSQAAQRNALGNADAFADGYCGLAGKP